MKIFQVGLFTIPLAIAIVALPGQAQARTFTYECDDGKSFQVEFTNESARLILSQEEVLNLSQVISASGARYSNDETTLFTKGNEAFIEVNDERTYNNCVALAPNPDEQTTLATPPATLISYLCRDGQTFQAAYRPESADLTLYGQTYTLSRIRSTPGMLYGVQYSDGYTTLASQENEAVIEVNGATAYQNCTAQATTTTGEVILEPVAEETIDVEPEVTTVQTTPAPPRPAPVRPARPAPVPALW